MSAHLHDQEEPMENKDKIILDLCGGTGSWSRPYKEAGYDVRLITLPEHDVLTYEPPEGVYGVLAAPPCTEFSLAKNRAPRDFETGMKTVEACLKIIWQCRKAGTLKFWALENPVGFLRQFLGRPQFTFYQWQFGESRKKRTDIWGYFTAPVPTVKTEPDEIKYVSNMKSGKMGVKKQDCPPEYAHLGLKRADIKAITPPGFARAFYEANK